jgi:hypothetical protein
MKQKMIQRKANFAIITTYTAVDDRWEKENTSHNRFILYFTLHIQSQNRILLDKLLVA